MTKSSVLIVGGGICGLMAATALHNQGMTVIVLDKGRGIGGRLASRRLRCDGSIGCFDFGAQYFKVRDPNFQTWVDRWGAAGVLTVWSEGMLTEQGEENDSGAKLYRGHPSNRSLAEYLAKDLTVINPVRVSGLAWQGSQWQINCDLGQSYRADRLVLTPPLPQTLALLAQSAIALPTDLHRAFQRIRYAPCITLLVLLEEPSQIPAPGGLWLAGEPLVWIACNTQKGISPGGHGVTIQGGAVFSQSHLQTPAEEVIQLMLAAADPWLGSRVLATHLHRWHYSHPLDFYDDVFVYGEFPGPVYFGGDAFRSGQIEGAALSGLAIAEDLLGKVIPQSDPIVR